MSGFVAGVLNGVGYGGLVLLMLAENLFPPMPSELVLPLAGFLVSQDRMALAPAVAASTVGSVLGALVLYGLGRSLGEERSKALLRRYGRGLGFTEAGFDRAAGVLRRRAPAVLFWSRFVPGVRSVVSIPAGVARVPLAVFVLWTTLSSLCWNTALVGAGVLLGRNWTAVLAAMDRYQAVLLWTAGALLAAFVLYRVLGLVGTGRARP